MSETPKDEIKESKEFKALKKIEAKQASLNANTTIDEKKENPVKNFFLRLIHLVYYYVPPCPACGSRKTGKFFTKHMRAIDNEYTTETSLKNGELVIPVDEIDPENQVFCAECGYTWDGPISTKFFSLKRIKEEAKARGTKEIYSEILLEKEEAEKNKKFKTIRKFVGKF